MKISLFNFRYLRMDARADPGKVGQVQLHKDNNCPNHTHTRDRNAFIGILSRSAKKLLSHVARQVPTKVPKQSEEWRSLGGIVESILTSHCLPALLI